MIAALPGALLIGISLGLLGSGGSILTVPVLTFFVGLSEKVAIASSLAIVGMIAAATAIPYAKRQLLDWRSVAWFGGPGMVGGWFGALLGGHVPGSVQLILFAIVMVIAAVLMLKVKRIERSADASPRKIWKIVIDGLLVGALTGLVGVGGGFLIVPALVLLGGLSMARAVGTSLVIIALKSASSFVKWVQVLEHLQAEAPLGMRAQYELNPWIILVVTAVGILGAMGGSFFAPRLPQAALRKSFAILCLVIAVPIAWSGVAAFS